ncbi:hypothetical protein SAMN05192574_102754 [Mucilaginibacter gossypiicola]|uniref:Uncharacterized protein n=1 Tax=Mucilaginibacter gossypiicola TaxID=551995 RepID=A0A1H8EKV2_9SPHI|nr:hypothetical protein SAMN05192574_102754 [Mucilaginibacter gossypiicola]
MLSDSETCSSINITDMHGEGEASLVPMDMINKEYSRQQVSFG